MSQLATGPDTGPLPGQAQEGLQQSQYRVVWPEPEAPAAPRAAEVVSRATIARLRTKFAIAVVN